MFSPLVRVVRLSRLPRGADVAAAAGSGQTANHVGAAQVVREGQIREEKRSDPSHVAVNSDVARVRSLLLTNLPFTDNLSGSNVISGLAGTGRGSNVGASREPGEPDHANQRGKHSVWLTWQPPPPAGVATIDTAGSSFDTLLAVYTGDSFSKFKPVASNDDVNSCDDPTGGFHTSRVSFNAQPGKVYHIAVDGLADAAGDIVLSWNLVPKDHLLPLVAI